MFLIRKKKATTGEYISDSNDENENVYSNWGGKKFEKLLRDFRHGHISSIKSNRFKIGLNSFLCFPRIHYVTDKSNFSGIKLMISCGARIYTCTQ